MSITSSQHTITFPTSSHIKYSNRERVSLPTPIPLYSKNIVEVHKNRITHPFKQNLYSSGGRAIPSPSREIVANIDAGVKRIKSAVIDRMKRNNSQNNNSQYMGWLLKARLEPLLLQSHPRGPTVDQCKGIVGCCRGKKRRKAHSLPDKALKDVRRFNRRETETVRSVRCSSEAKSVNFEQENEMKNSNTEVRPYCKVSVMNSPSPVRMVNVGKRAPPVTTMQSLEVKYKCFSAQFCGQYNVPGTAELDRPFHNVLVPRYGMFNADECYSFEHDAHVQAMHKPVVHPPAQPAGSSSAFNLELDFMLDKFDSDGEEPNPALNDVDHIAHKYYTKSSIPGMSDWEEMISTIADGALDMSGSQRKRKEKKSTKMRSPIIFTSPKRLTATVGVNVTSTELDNSALESSVYPPDVMSHQKDVNEQHGNHWYDVNDMRHNHSPV